MTAKLSLHQCLYKLKPLEAAYFINLVVCQRNRKLSSRDDGVKIPVSHQCVSKGFIIHMNP